MNEELERRVNLSAEMDSLYTRMIQTFVRSALYELPPELTVLTSAYGVDKEQVLMDALRMQLEKLESARENNPCEDQTNLFEFQQQVA